MNKLVATWLVEQVEKRGLFKVLVVLWVMLLTTIVVFWFLIAPEKLAGIAGTIGLGVIGLIGTAIAVLK